MTRRTFLQSIGSAGIGLLVPGSLALLPSAAQEQFKRFDGQDVFAHIMGKASAENWIRLPIGEVIGKVALELRGTPYVGFTLELSKDVEYCTINLKGLDCVTFFEDSLDIARVIKKGLSAPEDLLAEVRTTRYRGGNMGDFTTRLHYTTDWFHDNQMKGVVKVLTPTLPGAEPFTQKVGIMSEHPENYRQLASHPDLVQDIKLTEDAINARSMKYLPMEKLEAAEPLLKTGDIVGVTTSQTGIDIAHTGLCIKDEDGIVHFMDASSARSRMKVTVEPQISKCLNWSSKLTGVMIARPLEVR